MEVKNQDKSFFDSILEVVRAPFTQNKADDNNLITLISVARDNPVIRDQLLSILNQAPFQRQSLINTWLADLKLAGAPYELRTALSALLDEEIADRALILLQDSAH